MLVSAGPAPGCRGWPETGPKQNYMWKKIKEHLKEHGTKYLLAILSMLFGADQAGLLPEKAPQYGAGIETSAFPPGKAYEYTASFQRAVQIKVGNFPDVYAIDGLGVHTVYTSQAGNAAIEAAFAEATGFAGGKVVKVISARRRGGKAPEEGGEVGAVDDI